MITLETFMDVLDSKIYVKAINYTGEMLFSGLKAEVLSEVKKLKLLDRIVLQILEVKNEYMCVLISKL